MLATAWCRYSLDGYASKICTSMSMFGDFLGLDRYIGRLIPEKRAEPCPKEAGSDRGTVLRPRLETCVFLSEVSQFQSSQLLNACAVSIFKNWNPPNQCCVSSSAMIHPSSCLVCKFHSSKNCPWCFPALKLRTHCTEIDSTKLKRPTCLNRVMARAG